MPEYIALTGSNDPELINALNPQDAAEEYLALLQEDPAYVDCIIEVFEVGKGERFKIAVEVKAQPVEPKRKRK